MLKSLITRKKSSPTMVTKITHYNNLTMRLSLWSVNPYSAQWTLVWNNRIYYLANPSNNWNKIQIWNLDTLLIFLAKIKCPSMFEPSLATVVAGCGIRISGAPPGYYYMFGSQWMLLFYIWNLTKWANIWNLTKWKLLFYISKGGLRRFANRWSEMKLVMGQP